MKKSVDDIIQEQLQAAIDLQASEAELARIRKMEKLATTTAVVPEPPGTIVTQTIGGLLQLPTPASADTVIQELLDETKESVAEESATVASQTAAKISNFPQAPAEQEDSSETPPLDFNELIKNIRDDFLKEGEVGLGTPGMTIIVKPIEFQIDPEFVALIMAPESQSFILNSGCQCLVFYKTDGKMGLVPVMYTGIKFHYTDKLFIILPVVTTEA